MDVLLGIDVGGSGIKGAPVRLADGTLAAPRHRIRTPRPATPEAVAGTVGELVRHFGWTGPVGCAFPAVVKGGVVRTAANVDDAWVGCDAGSRFAEATGCPVTVVNDADAAGIAEATFGAARHRSGVVVVVTLGTGIGTAVLVDGTLLPNTELGHLTVRGRDAEGWAAESARDREDLSWKAWAERLDEYFAELERLLWPDLIVVGGGVSKKADRFLPLLHTRADIVPAELRNEAGIVGAAMAAARVTSP
ncbi:MAG: ROK family protein [Acidimicrobiia bacterium]|nr:ROK family protein [Acidimicrobiia bacterium]